MIYKRDSCDDLGGYKKQKEVILGLTEASDKIPHGD